MSNKTKVDLFVDRVAKRLEALSEKVSDVICGFLKMILLPYILMGSFVVAMVER